LTELVYILTAFDVSTTQRIAGTLSCAVRF